MRCAMLLQVQQQQQSWHQHYKNVQAASKGEAVTEAELIWALECVRSRAFSGPYSGNTLDQRYWIMTSIQIRFLRQVFPTSGCL